MKKFLAAAWLAALAAMAASGEDPANVKLRKDTPVEMRLLESLSSAESRTGQRVEFEVIDAIKAGSVAVIPRGAKAYGVIAEATPKGRMGRNGKLHLRIESVCLRDGTLAGLQALRDLDRERWEAAQSESSLGDSIMAIPAAPVLLFVQGKDISIPRGREVTAYLSGDVEIPAAGEPRKCAASAERDTAPAASAAMQLATVQVKSDPAGADIFVGGKFAGSTPSTLKLTPGEHTIALMKGDRKPWERRVLVTPGGDIHLDAVLESSGSFRVVGSLREGGLK